MTQEQRNIIKTKIQDEIAELSTKHNYLIIEGATGMGKALATIKCIDKSVSTKKWIITVPEIAQINNFIGEINKFGYGHLLSSKIEKIICYSSIKKYANKAYNIALNETQSVNENRLTILQTIDADQIIADSATIPTDVYYRLQQLGNFHIYSLSLKEGIDLGILPTPKIYLIPVTIESTHERFEYTKFKKICSGTASEYYFHLCDQIKYWRNRYNRENQKYMLNMSLQAASKRKKFLGYLKTIKAKELVTQFLQAKKRILVFSTDIKQSEELGTKEFTINSKKTPKVNAEIIRKFNDFEIDRIFPVGMLVSGMTLSQLDTGLIVQLDSGVSTENLKVLQQLGRLLRTNNPELYILYIPGTKDEEYMRNAIRALGVEFIVHPN